MPPDPDDPTASNPTPDPNPRPPARIAFRMPEWFLKHPPGVPFTDEERDRLREWFAQQLSQRGQLRAEPPPPEDPDPPPS